MRSRTILTVALFVLGNHAMRAQQPAGRVLPKAYGTNFQQVHVGAAAFRPVAGTGHFFDYSTQGYLHNIDALIESVAAPVTLPPGAEIHALCAYLLDLTDTGQVSVNLRSARLVPGGLEPAVAHVGPFLQSNWDTGYGVTCADFAPPYTYSEAADEDGVALAHFLVAYLPRGTGIGGVKIIWRQQVSPPPAAATFTDVPPNHNFFQFIEALAASGITVGCGNGTTFCPDAPLTRGQMAVFLSKALGLHWPY